MTNNQNGLPVVSMGSIKALSGYGTAWARRLPLSAASTRSTL